MLGALDLPTMSESNYRHPAVSNGHSGEQALIRKWWYETHDAKGCIVWEYYLGDCFVDAMWFPELSGRGIEMPGLGGSAKFPIVGVPVVLCEAKLRLTPELIGQALLYGSIARRMGADVRSIFVFSETVRSPAFKTAAEELGLQVVLPQATKHPGKHESA